MEGFWNFKGQYSMLPQCQPNTCHGVSSSVRKMSLAFAVKSMAVAVACVGDAPNW
jgi:hypothetical protein